MTRLYRGIRRAVRRIISSALKNPTCLAAGESLRGIRSIPVLQRFFMITWFSMLNYIIPLFALLFNLATFAFCVKFVLTRLWKYWVGPSLASLGLVTLSIAAAVNTALERAVPEVATQAYTFSMVLLVVGFIRLWSVILINYGLKKHLWDSEFRSGSVESENSENNPGKTDTAD